MAGWLAGCWISSIIIVYCHTLFSFTSWTVDPYIFFEVVCHQWYWSYEDADYVTQDLVLWSLLCGNAFEFYTVYDTLAENATRPSVCYHEKIRHPVT